jgi:hypothetical protein
MNHKSLLFNNNKQKASKKSQVSKQKNAVTLFGNNFFATKTNNPV